MSKTIALRTELQEILKNVTANVEYEEANDSTPYPYVVYELTEVMHDYGKTLFELEVNVMDYSPKSRVVDALADNIQDALHKKYYIRKGIQFVSYKDRRNIVREEDKQVKRRRLLFEVHLHELKGE